jgi:hypothetical protein
MLALDVVGAHWPGATAWHAVLAVAATLFATPQQIMPEPEQSLAASQLKEAYWSNVEPAGQVWPCEMHVGLVRSWSRQHVCVFKAQGVPQLMGPPS